MKVLSNKFSYYRNNNISSKQTFKGCDARPLKAVVTGNYKSITQSEYYPRWFDVLKELSEIFAKERNVDCIVLNQDGPTPVKSFLNSVKDRSIEQWRYLWMQDYITISPNKKMCALSFINFDKALAKAFGLTTSSPEWHVKGGNLFFVNDGKEDVLLIGSHDMRNLFPRRLNELKKTFNIEKVYTLSQPDYHIDLGIRPLNNRNILVNDFEMMSEQLKKYILKAKEYLSINPDDSSVQKVLQNLETALERHSSNVANSTLADADKISSELTALGFNPIRVPAALVNEFVPGNEYDCFSHYIYDSNFINAIVHERPDKSLLYLTNQPAETICTDAESSIGAKKIGFDLKTIFEDAVKKYVNKADIRYLSTQEILKNKSGGIHCLFAEIPS